MAVEDGLEALRMKRRARTVAPPKRLKVDGETISASPPEVLEAPKTATMEQAPEPRARAKPSPKPKIMTEERKGALPMADEREYSNLAVRVRRSLDRRAAKLVSAMFWDHNLKASKADLVELLLSELPDTPTEDLMSRLRAFKEQAPRP